MLDAALCMCWLLVLGMDGSGSWQGTTSDGAAYFFPSQRQLKSNTSGREFQLGSAVNIRQRDRADCTFQPL